MDQESDLENWARVNGYWYDNPQEYYKSLGYKFYGYGGEAQVYTEGDTYVHKVCRTGQYDNLIRFIDRITIQNALCPEASLEVEGFGRDSQHDFVVLMKQRFFRQDPKMEYYREWDRQFDEDRARYEDAKMLAYERKKKPKDDALVFRYPDGEQALAAAKKAIKDHPSYRFQRHKLEDGMDCFEVVEDNKVLERHIVQH